MSDRVYWLQLREEPEKAWPVTCERCTVDGEAYVMAEKLGNGRQRV